MTYLDGDNGWSKWVSNSNDKTVTLRTVIYDKSAGGIFNWLNPSFSHTDPGNSYYFDENYQRKYYRDANLVIKSLEIRLESIPLP